jgi:putative selenium metabolism protein SsnA
MLITNGMLITWENPNRILENHGIYIKDGKIVEIGPTKEMIAQYPGEQRLDAKGQYIMPGNICGHTHFYSAYSRGLSIPGAAPEDFPEILQKLWWRLDKSLTAEDIYYSALVSLVDAVKHGTTTLVDHHASPNAISGSLDEIARAVEKTGVRAVLCYEVTDRDGEAKAKAGIAENRRFIEHVQKNHPLEGKLGAMFGLHASLTLSEATLAACREAAPDGSGFHIHVAEHSVDEYDSLAKSGMRVVDRLAKAGILGKKSIAVHAVHIDAREIELLAETETWVTHQPRSNMNNAVGISAVESMMRAGVKVGLGNDGFSNAMWEEWKTAYFVHKLWQRDPRQMPATSIVQMAVYNNSELVKAVLPGTQIGILKPGAEADIIFVDYHPFTPVTADNLPWHIIFGFLESMISMTIIGGKVLMENHQLTTLDEKEIADQALRLAPNVWHRFQNQFVR